VKQLTIDTLCSEAARFAAVESKHSEPSLFGVTDGKAVGTYLEHKFRAFLRGQGYQFEEGKSANGIDFPGLLVDMVEEVGGKPAIPRDKLRYAFDYIITLEEPLLRGLDI